MQLSWLEPGGDPPPTVADLEAVGVYYKLLEVSANYQTDLDELKTARGYVEQDIVELRPDTPKLDELLEKFSGEHLHTDDEVRYVLEGEGVFEIRATDDRWIRAQVQQGDLIVVPKDLYHRFFLTEKQAIRCVRLFADPAGWVAHYRDAKRES
jgi:1,2-dihydroxy-3-keto-5-methylthiopentene dioxygenase